MLEVKFVYVVLSGAPELQNFRDPLEVDKKRGVPKVDDWKKVSTSFMDGP